MTMAGLHIHRIITDSPPGDQFQLRADRKNALCIGFQSCDHSIRVLYRLGHFFFRGSVSHSQLSQIDNLIACIFQHLKGPVIGLSEISSCYDNFRHILSSFLANDKRSKPS